MTMKQQKQITPGKPNNPSMYMLGLVALALNKVRHTVLGYKNPRPFSQDQIEKAIEYDIATVDHLLSAYTNYTKNLSVKDASILELGPGPDLGVGALLLAKGAASYTAFDMNRLIDQTDSGFYDALLETIKKPELKDELVQAIAGSSDRLQYRIDKHFSVASLPKGRYDLILSQAAFEHFTSVETTISELTTIAKPGTVLVAEVDCMTHTRGIREKDPLNIYRFAPWLYKLLRFTGIPNRVRPETYKQLLERYGWSDVQIVPIEKASKDYVDHVKSSIHSSFYHSDLSVLTCYIFATK